MQTFIKSVYISRQSQSQIYQWLIQNKSSHFPKTWSVLYEKWNVLVKALHHPNPPARESPEGRGGSCPDHIRISGDPKSLGPHHLSSRSCWVFGFEVVVRQEWCTRDLISWSSMGILERWLARNEGWTGTDRISSSASQWRITVHSRSQIPWLDETLWVSDSPTQSWCILKEWFCYSGLLGVITLSIW